MVEDIEEKVKCSLGEILEEINLNIDEMNEDSLLIDYGMNSIYFVLLVVKIEEEFNIEFDDEYLDMSLFNTLKDVVCYINIKLNQER